MSELELPVIDKELGVVVSRVNVDSYSAGTGWYVHQIPDKEDRNYGRWRQSDKIAKWCDEELVKLPESDVPDDVDSEWVKEKLEEVLLESGESVCKRCAKSVPVGSLCADGGYVPTVCPECAGKCPDCGGKDWKAHSGNEPNNARKHSYKVCCDCGNKVVSSPATA